MRRRSVAKRFVVERAPGYPTSHTISIVCPDRTLDFELEENLWGKLYHALQILKNHYSEG